MTNISLRLMVSFLWLNKTSSLKLVEFVCDFLRIFVYFSYVLSLFRTYTELYFLYISDLNDNESKILSDDN